MTRRCIQLGACGRGRGRQLSAVVDADGFSEALEAEGFSSKLDIEAEPFSLKGDAICTVELKFVRAALPCILIAPLTFSKMDGGESDSEATPEGFCSDRGRPFLLRGCIACHRVQLKSQGGGGRIQLRD